MIARTIVVMAAAMLMCPVAVIAQSPKLVVKVTDTHTTTQHPPNNWPGAAGDGSTDDTSAIQGAIYYALESANRNKQGAVVFFPEGRYGVTSTIDIPHCGGLDLAGASAHLHGSTIGVYNINSAMIIADFPDSSAPLLNWKASFCQCTDLLFVAHTGCSGSHALPLALIYTNSGSGVVTGVRFDNVHFLRSDDPSCSDIRGTAVSLGSGTTDPNNSEIDFYRCRFQGLNTCVVVNTDQGVDYVFEQVGAGYCKTFLDLVRGGNASVNIANFTHCGGSGSGDWIFKLGVGGINSGIVKISGAHFEDGCQKLLQCDGQHHVLLENAIECFESAQSAAPIQLGTGSLVCSNCKFQSFPLLQFLTVSSPGVVGTVRFLDCTLPLVTPGTTAPTVPSSPTSPPSGLITGTGKYVYAHCTGWYTPGVYYPLANATNITGW